jgi:hypothetical protein
VRYRYYISSVLIQGQADKAATLNRAPAAEIETLIIKQFNTTTSMGRLTLNVLLSFAQVRARGHLRAHPRQDRGLQTQGPFGSAVWFPWVTKPRIERFTVVADEAKTVRHIFRRYLDLGSLNLLLTDLRRTGVKTKLRPLLKRVPVQGQMITRRLRPVA